MKTFNISSLFKFIYLGVTVIMLFYFFTGEETINYNVDGLDIIETSSIEYPVIPKKIKSLELSYKGLSFNISNQSPIILSSTDNINRSSKIRNIKIIDNTLRLNLENHVNLDFRVDNHGDRLTISSNIPKVFPTISKLTIPYNLKGNYELEYTDLSYKFSNDTNEFHLKLNDKYQLFIEEQKIVLLAEDDKLSTLTFSPLSNSELPIAEQWYLKYRIQYDLPLRDLIDDYLRNVERSIRSIFNPIMFIPESETWNNIPSVANFTENKVIVYLADAMQRNNYTKSLQKILGIKKRYPSIFGFPSTPFLGNIVVNGKKGVLSDINELQRINTQINRADPDIFQKRIPKHFFPGDQIDIKKLEELIISTDNRTLNLQGLSVALWHLLLIVEQESLTSDMSNSIKEITDLIIEKIRWDETGLYLVDNSNLSSQLLNFITGELLIEASQFETSEYSKSIGEALIYTFINNSERNGNISTTYNFEDKSFSISKNTPENIYLLLSDNVYLPHFYQDRDIKVWTISESVQIDKSLNKTRITITYPVDKSVKVNYHFLVIQGVKPYNQLFFKNRPWRADSKFERYGVGYYYEQSTKLLYFMPNHSKSREEIIINY